MNIIITTADKPDTAMCELAASLAKRLNAPQVPRNKAPLAALRQRWKSDVILVVTKHGPVAHTAGGEYYFHLSMANLRIKNLRNGKPDHMVEAMQLTPGASVLDCTLGLASDAVVAAFITGASGRVTGIEHSPVLAALAAHGLVEYDSGDQEINRAMHAIQVVEGDYNAILPTLPTHSYDVVYIDPMFRIPVMSSSNMLPLRELADMSPIAPAAVREACRVARKRVVIKETPAGHEFNRLGIKDLYGGRYSSIRFGVIETGTES